MWNIVMFVKGKNGVELIEILQLPFLFSVIGVGSVIQCGFKTIEELSGILFQFQFQICIPPCS